MLTARVMLFFANSFFFFAVEAFLEGVAFALNSGTISAYIYSLFGKDSYGNNVSKFYNFGTLAFIVSTISFPFINYRFNIRALILATIVANGISFFISTLLPDTTTKNSEADKTDLYSDLKQLAIDKKFRKIVFIVSLINLSFLLVNFFYVQILIENGIDENMVSPLILAYSTIQLSQTYIIRFLGEKDSLKNIQKLCLLASIFFLGLCFFKGNSLIIFMAILPTILTILAIYVEKIQNNYIDDQNFNDYRATILSAFNFFANVFEVVFLLFNSYISALNYKFIFLFMALLFITNIINSKTLSTKDNYIMQKYS